jgi:hypothetical protein
MRIGTIDPRFGLSVRTVDSLTRAAIALWREGTGRDLMALGDSGVPISFVYDARFERELSRRAALAALAASRTGLEREHDRYEASVAVYDSIGRDIDAAHALYADSVRAFDVRNRAYVEAVQSYESMRDQYRARLQAYNTAMQQYNDSVTAYNTRVIEARGEQPRTADASLVERGRRLQASAAELAARQRELAEEHAAVEARFSALAELQRPLDTARGRLDAARRAVNARVADHAAMRTRLLEQRAVLEAEQRRVGAATDTYNRQFETLADSGDRVSGHFVVEAGTGAKIAVFTFRDLDDLVLVIAHEMGHALGLGHAEDPAAVMYRQSTGTQSRVTAADRALFESLCPGASAPPLPRGRSR